MSKIQKECCVMSESIRVIVQEPFKKAEVKFINNTLEEKQAIVGGYIEYIPYNPSFEENYTMYGNEEAKILQLPYNFPMFYQMDGNTQLSDVILGTVLILKKNAEGQDVSLDQDDVDHILNLMENKEDDIKELQFEEILFLDAVKTKGMNQVFE